MVKAKPADELAKVCACTGVRWCAACRDPRVREAHGLRDPLSEPRFSRVATFDARSQCAPGIPSFTGLRLLPDFLSEGAAAELLCTVETTRFLPSQSGKLKQHYGPKMNFTKRKMNASEFRGIPSYAHEIEARVRSRALDLEVADPLSRYQTTDVFVLRYQECDLSNLDFHSDDDYAYGEVILDLSLESDSVLTFHHPQSGECVRAPLPARSLVLLFGRARYEWEHAILAADVSGRRTSITLRTLGAEPRTTEAGRRVLEEALPTCSSS
jgi:alkylated DNA repair dioxygenase AlkB